ncbi:uncharacterized protein LOC121728160 [Aricia agestis]|uniref:uncharacterized protein LOC121728160 n=1 Tax=Aricia agestis TaxID=91739 RepID=UPI001C209060|nr:uncharacterized protein LOC121728160 [Aricia agestis]
MRREMALYMAELREYRQEMSEWRSDVHKRLDSLERRIELVEQRQENPPSSPKVAELEMVVSQLKSELNDRDQEALLTDLDVGNLPETTGENTVHTVTVLATKLGVQLSSADIVFAERVGAVERSPTGDVTAAEERRARRIVVRLARRDLRDELLQAARVRRTLSSTDLGAPGAPRRVYVNERLTRANRALFHQAREECRRLQWRYSWTKRGRIFVRLADGKPVHAIRTEADLTRVFNSANVG